MTNSAVPFPSSAIRTMRRSQQSRNTGPERDFNEAEVGAQMRFDVQKEVAIRNVRLAADVERNLQTAGYPALRGLEVFASGGAIVVRGTVVSYFMKQVVQETVMRTVGVQTVTNQVEVRERLPLHCAATGGR